MRFSFSTVYTTIFANTALFLLAACLMRSKAFRNRKGYKFLATLLALSVCRLMIPLEFTFTKTLRLPKGPSLFISAFHHTLFYIAGYSVTPLTLLGIIWISGIIIQFSRLVNECINTGKYIRKCGWEVTKEPRYASTLAQILREKGKEADIRIYKMQGINSPMLCGLTSPRILLPNRLRLTDRELYFVLSHETAHYFHCDLLLKYILRLISVLYWWNPVCYFLRRRADLLFEMRIDDKIAGAEPTTAAAYMECLFHVLQNASNVSPPGSMYITLGRRNLDDLKKRFEILMYKAPRHYQPLHAVLTIAALGLCLYSYLFTWEAAYTSPEFDSIYTPFTDENTYFIDNGDGSYDIYLYGEYWFKTDSLEYYPDKIPIYHSKEEFTNEIDN